MYMRPAGRAGELAGMVHHVDRVDLLIFVHIDDDGIYLLRVSIFFSYIPDLNGGTL